VRVMRARGPLAEDDDFVGGTCGMATACSSGVPEPGSNDAAPVQRPCIAHYLLRRPPGSGGAPRAPTAPPWRVVFHTRLADQRNNPIVASAAGAPYCQSLGNGDLRMNQHYALPCRTSNYLNTRPNSATAVIKPYLRRTDWGACSGGSQIQQGAPMPLKQPVTFTAASGRVVQGSN
jgi:hypothetical protein